MKKKKRKINKQKIFSFVSLIFIIICILWYGGRLIYFYLDNKKTNEKEANIFAKVLLKEKKDKEEFKQVKEVYYFNGKVKDNYVMYSNMLWRIVKINKDNTVTLISENVIGTLNNGKDTYEKSSVITWLNKEKEKDYSGVVENVLSNKDSFLVKSNICTDTINDVNKITCNKTNNTYDIGLLSIEDYLYTGGNKGFINNGKITYLANQSKNKNYWYITNEGKLDSDSENEIIGIRPVITIASTIEAKEGDGSKEKPYTFSEEKNYFASYVKLGNDIWRVYESDEDKLKLILDKTLENKDNTAFKYLYSKKNYQYNDTTYGTLAYYLNKTYYKGLDYGSIIVENNYTNSTYGEDNNYSLEELSKNTISTKIALPSINDIIVNDEIEGYVTTTGVSENDTYIYIRNASGTISQKNISYENKVRPCISIKKESLTQGNGTEKDPYRLGE